MCRRTGRTYSQIEELVVFALSGKRVGFFCHSVLMQHESMKLLLDILRLRGIRHGRGMRVREDGVIFPNGFIRVMVCDSHRYLKDVRDKLRGRQYDKYGVDHHVYELFDAHVLENINKLEAKNAKLEREFKGKL